jgi:DNA-binding NtrC family response regulator
MSGFRATPGGEHRAGVGGSSVVMVEDDQVLGRSLVQRLRLAGVTTHWARTVAEAEALLRRHRPTLVLCDIRLPDGSGEALIKRLMPELGGVPIVAMTAYGGVEQAVRLLRAGVDDYLPKPFPVQQLLDKLAAFAATRRQAGRDDEADALDPAAQAGWRSAPMRALRAALGRLAPVTAPVLLCGESGVGKGVAARRLHAMGPQAGHPFTVIDCAALPADTTEAELLLFGREGSAEAAAPGGGPGLIEQAGEGTLFLDEVAELALPMQARLLRLVEERCFLRIGGRAEQPLRARLVAATNADLRERAEAGGFRRDLWFRLSVAELAIAPLRDRPEDIEDLARHFLHRFSRAAGAAPDAPHAFAADAAAALHTHPWPGNVRELRNRVERAVLLSATPRLAAADLFPDRGPAAPGGPPPDPTAPGDAAMPGATEEGAAEPQSLAAARDTAEREHIRRVLARCGGRVGDAARALGVSRTTLWERMRRLGVPTR